MKKAPKAPTRARKDAPVTAKDWRLKGAEKTAAAQAVRHVEEAISAFGPRPLALTPRARMVIAKPGSGDLSFVPRILAVAEQHGLLLAQGEAALAQLAEGRALEALEDRVLALAARATDARLKANAEAWTTATTVYGVLTQLARTDAKLRVQLEPIKAFFTRGRRAPAPKKAAKPTGKPAAKKAKK